MQTSFMRIPSANTRPEKENTPSFRLTSLTALVVVDSDGDEGIPAIQGLNGMLLPCVAGDESRLKDYLQMAQRWVEEGQVNMIKVIKFTNGETIKTFKKDA